mgnify:FL=1
MGFRSIIDSTAFYAGLPFHSFECYYTTDLILDELNRITFFRIRIETLLSNDRLLIHNPLPVYYSQVQTNAQKIEKNKELSPADISVLALALDFQVQGIDNCLISDDYGVQNLAQIMNLKFNSILYTGIKYSGIWIKFCPYCRKLFDSQIKICSDCGSSLKKKLKKISKDILKNID